MAHLVVWQFQLENVLLRQSNMKKMSHSRQDTDKNLRLFPSYGHLRSCVTYQRKLMTTHHTPEYVLIWFKSLTWPKYNSCNGFSILNQCSSIIIHDINNHITRTIKCNRKDKPLVLMNLFPTLFFLSHFTI